MVQTAGQKLVPNHIYTGDAVDLLDRIDIGSISLSFWSPPYFVGKPYEAGLSYEEWQTLLRKVIDKHNDILIGHCFG